MTRQWSHPWRKERYQQPLAEPEKTSENFEMEMHKDNARMPCMTLWLAPPVQPAVQHCPRRHDGFGSLRGDHCSDPRAMAPSLETFDQARHTSGVKDEESVKGTKPGLSTQVRLISRDSQSNRDSLVRKPQHHPQLRIRRLILQKSQPVDIVLRIFASTIVCKTSQNDLSLGNDNFLNVGHGTRPIFQCTTGYTPSEAH